MLTHTLAASAASWGVLMALAPGLQIRRMVRSRSSRDVSVSYFGVLIIGFGLWLGYGISSGTVILIVPNALALLTHVTAVMVAWGLRANPSEPVLPTRSDSIASGSPTPEIS
ncbi:MAG: hypothetical protein DLM57_13370 [Pseudonocardiales bacterium]|nr:MAG: hypothetical protein DLM57_13370 [Pseudonocardiales bacterium]